MLKIISYLIRDKDDAAQRRILGAAYGAVGIVLNIILFIVKYAVAARADSIAIAADSFNNLCDAAAALITMMGFRIACVKPSKKHPFGFGRAEYLSGFAVSVFVIAVGLGMLRSSAEKIIFPEQVRFSPEILLMLTLTVAVKFYLFISNKTVGGRIDSAGMKANSTNSLSDCFATGAIIISAIAGDAFSLCLDGIAGAAVAVFITYAGVVSALQSLSPLLGENDEVLTDAVHETLSENGNVAAVSGVAIHDYGPNCKTAVVAVKPKRSGLQAQKTLKVALEKKLHDELSLKADVIIL